MKQNSRILVVGHETPIGSALCGQLRKLRYTGVFPRAGKALNMGDIRVAETCFNQVRPEFVFVTGGKSGGIAVNQAEPADLMLDNMRIACNAIEAARRHKVRKLLFLGSSCAYPKQCPQPMRPEYLMTGVLEPTSAPYAVSKLAGITMCRAYRRQYGCNFIAGIPADSFGPGDDFDPAKSHVVAALMRRMHEARMSKAPEVIVWGSGRPKRDFIFSADLADACICVMKHHDGEEPINLGCNRPVSIRDLAFTLKKVVGYRGKIVFDRSKPDGMPKKWLDAAALSRLGWKSFHSFEEGLKLTYKWFLKNV